MLKDEAHQNLTITYTIFLHSNEFVIRDPCPLFLNNNDLH